MLKSGAHDSQNMQRIKVGMTGLALVLLLIGLAGAIFNSANREAPVTAVGGSKPDVVANLALDNTTKAAGGTEPLADLGVAPSTSESDNAATPKPDTPPAAPAPSRPAGTI